MNTRSRKKMSGAKAEPEGGQALYVYCVGERDALKPLLEGGAVPVGVESGAALELVASGELAAVVSGVPLSDYNEEALKVRLADPSWTATRAMRHEQVVEHFARRASLVPLRFGTIYLGREGVERMLEERRAQLRRSVERVREREEWGVNLYCDRALLRERATELSQRLRELAAQAAQAPPGQGYLLRKKIDAMRADEAREVVKRVAAEVENALAAEADGATRLRVLKDEAGEHGELAAKLAFLVARQSFDRFHAAAERLAAAHADAGFRLELTGPWPPYNFAADEGERQ